MEIFSFCKGNQSCRQFQTGPRHIVPIETNRREDDSRGEKNFKNFFGLCAQFLLIEPKQGKNVGAGLVPAYR
jgi:hypothetical protein